MTIWKGDFPEPFKSDSEEGAKATALLANLHLSHVGNASFFVSLLTSLLQTIVYARKKKEAYLAIVDLCHPALNVPDKRSDAAGMLRWLHSIGQAQWARYKGQAEYLYWFNVPPESILAVVSVDELVASVEESEDLTELLRLDDFAN